MENGKQVRLARSSSCLPLPSSANHLAVSMACNTPCGMSYCVPRLVSPHPQRGHLHINITMKNTLVFHLDVFASAKAFSNLVRALNENGTPYDVAEFTSDCDTDDCRVTLTIGSGF